LVNPWESMSPPTLLIKKPHLTVGLFFCPLAF
jgi:hypothetical protein